ncbi:MAG: extracellular solute-binding protein [Streptosporangiales bacterium]|nr:extracellular solute-binding protein [Streptosporangiales bacterium]
MFTWTRRSAALAAAACLATSVVACGGGGGGGGDALVLSELDPYTEKLDGQITANILDRCGKRAGVTVDRQAVPGTEIVPQVLRQASSRSLPSLLLLDNLYVQQIAETGALTPLDSYGFKDTDSYYESAISAGTYKNKLYGLPTAVDTLALYYNKEMFSKAGLSPPKDWTELTEAAQKLSGGSRYGIAFSAVANEEGTFQFLPFFWGAGAELTKPNSPEAVKAVDLWTKLVQGKAASRSVLNWTQADVTDQFIAGNAAMMVNGPWALAELKEQKDVEYGVVPIPAPDGGKATVPLGGEVWVIPATDDEQQQKAWQVLQCMNEPKNMLEWGEKTAHLPATPEVAEQMSDPVMRSFADALPETRPRTDPLGPRYPDASKALWTALQAAITGQATPEEALANAQ